MTYTESRRIYTSPEYRRLRDRTVRLAGWKCERCGLPGRLEVHHKLALTRGGAALDPANLECLCVGCHVSHHRPAKVNPALERWRALRDELR